MSEAERHATIACPVDGVRQSITVKILFIRFRSRVITQLRTVQLMSFRYVGWHKGTIATIIHCDVIKTVGLQQSFLAVSFKAAKKTGGDIILASHQRSIITIIILVIS